jgi:hypothetical protein
MVTSTSRLAYSDCFDLMDKAIADPKGIKIKFAAGEDAWHFRIRLHTARKIDRIDNKDVYEERHPLYGRSVYDQLTMRIRTEPSNGTAWLRLERIDTREFEIESLTEPEKEPELAFTQTAIIKQPEFKKSEEHRVEPIRRMLRRM